MTVDGASERIALTVIGGYLGSGKTTLVNHLLRDAQERIAVLVNDFGDINVDFDLIESRDDNTIELSNGCICCSMVDGFSAALDTVLAISPRPSRLVIEASGVADPAQVAAYGHGPGLSLDAVIVMVDASTIRRLVDDKYVDQTVRNQLVAADVLVANKADLVSADDLDDIVDWLRDFQPGAFVVTATESQVAPEIVFGRPTGVTRAPTTTTHVHANEVFRTYSLSPAGPLERAEVDELMQSLPAETTVRAKGLVHLSGEELPFVLQRVGQRWTLRRHTSEWADDPQTAIAVIEVG